MNSIEYFLANSAACGSENQNTATLDEFDLSAPACKGYSDLMPNQECSYCLEENSTFYKSDSINDNDSQQQCLDCGSDLSAADKRKRNSQASARFR